MKNEYMRPASELSLPVPAGAVSGDPIAVGSITGVLATDRDAGGNIAGFASVVIDDRSYEVDVDGAIAGVGTPIFVTATRTLTTTATGNTLFGHSVPKADGSLATKGAGVGPAIVRHSAV